MTLREMADELGVTDRTIRRDLDVFRGVGFPLMEDVGDFGRKTWRLAACRDQPGLGFAFDEAVALLLGRRMMDPLAGTAFGEAARRAFAKIRALLNAEALNYIDRFGALFHQTGIALRDFSPKAELLDTLQLAVEDRKQVRIGYRSEASPASTARDVSPCGFVYHRGSIYLVALDPRDGKTKHFKLDRIDSVEVGSAASGVPDGFDLASHMAESFGVYRGDGEPTEVRVRFGPEAARYIQESRWHPSQRLTVLPDGGVMAEFRVSGTAEIKSWVLGFGAKAVVVSPESLREEIAGEIRKLASAYATPRCPAEANDSTDQDWPRRKVKNRAIQGKGT